MFWHQKPRSRCQPQTVVPTLITAAALRSLALACLVGLSGCGESDRTRLKAAEKERISADAQLRAIIERCGHVGDPVDETVVCLAAAGYDGFRDVDRYYSEPPVTMWSARSAPGLYPYISLSGVYDMKERKIISFQGQVNGVGRGTGKPDDIIVQKILRHLPIVH